MAEALISVLLEQLITITREWITKEVRLVKHVEKDLSSLKSELEAIQTVLEDAEKKQLEDAGVRRWLDQLKQVSYDMNNVLDEWSTELLISEIQNQVDAEEGDRHNVIVSKMKKVCSSLRTSCFCLTQLKQVGVRHEVAVKVKELKETLEKIARERNHYSLKTTNVLIPKGIETISSVDESEIYGREGDKEFIVSKLLCNGSHGGKSPAIIPLVGMGGIGKTTLAQLAFNADEVKAHFGKRVWVCVSDPFDEIQIAKAIVEALNGSCPNLAALESLLQYVRESIEGNKFLLVLDDVWFHDRGDGEKWEQLELSLQSGALGSRIMITTRKEEVAIMMGVADQVINLELLSEEHCWLIFSRLAFRGKNSEERKQLEGIGRSIARKCKGLPLVAKSLGGLMCFKEAKADWEDVLSSRIWESQDDNIKFFAPFLLSYYDLPPLEKRCFLYCSVFLKDHVFDMDDLIEVWMSQGYLSSNENPEKVGRNCFRNLIMRSFFQDFVKDLDGRILTCKMHDILHDLALFLTRNECVTLKVDRQLTELPSVEKVRHFTLILTAPDIEVGFPTSMFGQTKSNSLFIVRSDDTILGNGTMFFPGISHFPRHLRTLNLSRCGVSVVPEQLGQLRHLRYLNLSYNRFSELPDGVCGLCNLQTLRIECCLRLERLPEGMGKLLKLRHLHIRRNCRLKGLPKGVGRLAHLQTLDTLVIPENNKEYLSIKDLVKLNHLRSTRVLLIMGCGNLKNLDEVEGVAGLINRGGIVRLYLMFRLKNPEQSLEDDSMILDALQPQPSLRWLDIEGYAGVNMNPKWMMSLVSLTELHLISCKTCETLPPLGSLPSLERLIMFVMRSLRKIGREFMGFTRNEGIAAKGDDQLISFPKLKQLVLWMMNGLEEWEDCESTNSSLILMPCLESLEILDCSVLTLLPDFLKVVPLKHLTIVGCPILSKSFQQSAKEWDKISHIPNFKNDFNDVN